MSDDSNSQDAGRAKTADDILGISHGGGRDQYGGQVGGGTSAGGAYPNPHSRGPGGEGGGRYGGHSNDEHGGQSNIGYYGGGQMGDRNFTGRDNAAGSTAGGSTHGERTYQDSQTDGVGQKEGELAAKAAELGAEDHAGFGAGHQGQHAQGQQSGKAG